MKKFIRRKMKQSVKISGSFDASLGSRSVESTGSSGASLRNAVLRGFRRRASLPLTSIVDDQLSMAGTDITIVSEIDELSRLSPAHENENDKRPTLPAFTKKIPLTYEPTDSFSRAIQLWLEAAEKLAKSPEMGHMVHQTNTVVHCASSMVLSAVTLPVRLPLHVCCTSVHQVLSLSGALVENAAALLSHDGNDCHQKNTTSRIGSGQEQEEDRGLIDHVLSLPGAILGFAGHLAITVVSPVLGQAQTTCQEPNKEVGAHALPPQKPPKASATVSPSPRRTAESTPDYLDRLRLDYSPNCKENFANQGRVLYPVNKPLVIRAQPSKYLLRVNDLGLHRKAGKVLYIDLNQDHRDNQLTKQALDQLVVSAISLLANHPVVCFPGRLYKTTTDSEIRWNNEGSSKRILRKMSLLDEREHLDLLLQETLIWSGQFQHNQQGYGRKHGFFLARGAIRMAPRDFMELLWDNNRTSEYNNYCLGRNTLLTIGEDAVLRGASTSTKVIKSEMRVPFAGITVKAICLMHVCPIGEDGSFVIVSRTLDCGTAGTHFSTSDVESGSPNEILWGCNLIRSVPGEPGVTDLTSVSQVGSNVPNFLASKIGLVGIGDFFKNVRAVAR